MKKHIPNIITCCNLLSGSVAVVFACEGSFTLAFLMILLGAFFDFFDGMSARALRVGQPIGKELDSLADDITFGLAPAVMLFTYLRPVISWWALFALLMAAFSALRLAKFNLDERQTSSFIGLATPANAIFWASLIAYLSCVGYAPLWLCLSMLVFSLFSCWLLIAEVPFFSLKFHNMKWADNKVKYVFAIGSVCLIVAAIATAAVCGWQLMWSIGAIIIIWYIVLALATSKL
ncbi:MAG: CDP-diacylglycerol--serine O-phosphatidyltransferase [Paludibacteraceae bacterium]|nr:CDP-diacylglycerol--serine O-phosphatidyltransferase [Paludibacteraceae bacterium]